MPDPLIDGRGVNAVRMSERADKSARATPAQKRLIAEIREVAEVTGMDFWSMEGGGRSTDSLQMVLRQFVNGRIIARYTMTDEYLAMIICDFYFRRRKGEKTYSRLWKLKEFRIFNHFLLDEATTITKMNMAKAISPLPGSVEEIINRINAVRNVVAHSFFPENRRKYMNVKRVLYNGSNIYSAEGMRKLEDDFQIVRKSLESKIDDA